MSVPRADLHQQLWPDELIRALAERVAPPRLRHGAAGWTLELPGEPPCPVALADHDPVARAFEAERDGLDTVGIALSVPLGIELLPLSEAQPLLDAFHDGVAALGGPFRFWGATALTGAGAGALEIDRLLDRGAIGATVPAGALAGEVGLVRLSALLDRLQARDVPLFVHPGPAPTAHRGAPPWWPAMTAYVADMHAAWHARAAWGRAAHPPLRVLFAMLAGGAPLHAERLAVRGGPAAAVHDELTFFDVSSYGPRTVDAMLRIVGADRLVYGSDRPVAEPSVLDALGPSVAHALAEANPARLLSPDPVIA